MTAPFNAMLISYVKNMPVRIDTIPRIPKMIEKAYLSEKLISQNRMQYGVILWRVIN